MAPQTASKSRAHEASTTASDVSTACSHHCSLLFICSLLLMLHPYTDRAPMRAKQSAKPHSQKHNAPTQHPQQPQQDRKDRMRGTANRRSNWKVQSSTPGSEVSKSALAHRVLQHKRLLNPQPHVLTMPIERASQVCAKSISDCIADVNVARSLVRKTADMMVKESA